VFSGIILKRRDLRHRISADIRKSELIVENTLNHFNKFCVFKECVELIRDNTSN
jgi:hypothetical protein